MTTRVKHVAAAIAEARATLLPLTFQSIAADPAGTDRLTQRAYDLICLAEQRLQQLVDEPPPDRESPA